MNVRQLIQALSAFPQDMHVMVPFVDGGNLVHDFPSLLPIQFDDDGEIYEVLVVHPEKADYYENEED